MTGTETDLELAGTRGRVVVRRRDPEGAPRYVVLLAHGYGEHAGRYEHVATTSSPAAPWSTRPTTSATAARRASACSSTTSRTWSTTSTRSPQRRASEHPGLPIVLHRPLHGRADRDPLRPALRRPSCGLVLSGPVIGGNPGCSALLRVDPIPDVPIDPAILSRDPAVGEAYGQDPLVWHGPFKRATLEAFVAAVDTISRAAASATCRCCGCTARTTSSSRSTPPAR